MNIRCRTHGVCLIELEYTLQKKVDMKMPSIYWEMQNLDKFNKNNILIVY
jgi:hypothetical protein